MYSNYDDFIFDVDGICNSKYEHAGLNGRKNYAVIIKKSLNEWILDFTVPTSLIPPMNFSVQPCTWGLQST